VALSIWFVLPLTILMYTIWCRHEALKYTIKGRRGAVDSDMFCCIGGAWLIAGLFLFNGCKDEGWVIGGSTKECWLIGGAVIVIGVLVSFLLLVTPRGRLLGR
jgi:hypothetical protein